MVIERIQAFGSEIRDYCVDVELLDLVKASKVLDTFTMDVTDFGLNETLYRTKMFDQYREFF